MKCYPKWLWILQIIAAIILFQTLWFKFTGAPEAVATFTLLGMEPTGRILIGLLEGVAGLFLLIPRLVASGGLLAMGLMLGAIIAHFTRLGIVVENDGGLLFGLAVTVFVMATIITYIRRHQLPFIDKTC